MRNELVRVCPAATLPPRLPLRLVGLLLGLSFRALAQESAGNPAAQPAQVDYATLQFIAPGDSAAVIAEEAAKVLPRPNQTAWMRLERTFFLHYGPNPIDLIIIRGEAASTFLPRNWVSSRPEREAPAR